jgi:tetratricopeptide (TPR) repeat protein
LPALSFTLLAMGLRADGDMKTTESVLRQGLAQHPRDVWIHLDLADCLGAMGRQEEAIRYYMVARFFRPDTAFGLANLLQDKGDTDDAIAVMQDLCLLKPDDGMYRCYMGRLLKEQGREREAFETLDAAISMLRVAVSRDPKDADAHHSLGLALLWRGKLDEAIAEYREAMRLGRNDDWVHANLGSALRERGKLEEAVAQLREAVRIGPNNARARCDLGCALHDHGKMEEAVAEFRAAIRLKLDNACTHHNLGEALRHLGQMDQAIAEYRLALTLKPDHVIHHSNFAFALEAQGKHDEAIVQFREWVRLKPDEGKAHNELAWALVLPSGRPRSEYDEGLQHARKAVQLAAKDGDSINTLALAEYRTGHWAESLAASERSMPLRKGGDASDWFFMAMAIWQKGDRKRARTWFDKAITWTNAKAPENKEFLQFWKEAASLMGQPGPAQPVASADNGPTERRYSRDRDFCR